MKRVTSNSTENFPPESNYKITAHHCIVSVAKLLVFAKIILEFEFSVVKSVFCIYLGKSSFNKNPPLLDTLFVLDQTVLSIQLDYFLKPKNKNIWLEGSLEFRLHLENLHNLIF
jgi:hypothetical protein